MHAIERNWNCGSRRDRRPRIDLDLRIAGPEALEVQRESLAIPPMSSIAPEEAALWTAEQREFRGFADFAGQSGWIWISRPLGLKSRAGEAPAAVEVKAPVVACRTAIGGSRAQSWKHRGWLRRGFRQQVLERLPVIVQGIAAGRAKAAQVFGAALFTGKSYKFLRRIPVAFAAADGAGASRGRGCAGDGKEIEERRSHSAAGCGQAKLAGGDGASCGFLSAEPDLGLPELRLESGRNAGASHMPKILAAIAGAAALGFGIFFFLGRGDDAILSRPWKRQLPARTGSVTLQPTPRASGRVSVLRASMGLPAYRLDFESSIQIKGLGWVYRAQDAKNYYVSKIELEKPGQNPEFAIVHYAVIDGVEQAHEQTPLHVGVPLGGHYKIRFEAVDDRFTTWVQGQQVDQWTDGRLKTGGAGLYREGAEQFTLHGDFQVTPLAK